MMSTRRAASAATAGWRRASEEGHTAIVKMLLKAGANVNIADKNGKTALSQARGMGHTEIIAMLRAAGAR